MLRTCSLPPSSNRATFPFKPASAMKTESHGSGGLPSVFRPRPIVQALTLHEQPPRHCASFPIDKHSNSNQPSSPSPPPDWLVSDLQNCKTPDRFFFSDCKSLPPFPVPIDLPLDSRCWWLREMQMTRCVVARRLNTMVQVGEDEIECVQSHASTEELYDAMNINEDETHSFSYCTTQEGPAQPKDTEEGNAKVEMAIASLSFSSLEILDDLQEKQFSLDDIRILQEEMKDLRAEIEQTTDLDADKRCKMEALFYQVEGALKVNEEMIESSSGVLHGEKAESPSNEFTPSAVDHVRRTTVAITGGTLTIAGAALIPCPVIPGCLILYGGLLVLATEFDSAKKALNTIKEPIEKWLGDDDMEEDPKNAAEDENLCNSLLWEGLVGYSGEKCKNEIDDEFLAMMGMNRKKNDGSVDSGKAKKKNPIKPYLRKLFTSMNSSMESESGKRNDGATDGRREESDCNRHKVVESNSSPCHGDISSCQMFAFDFEGDDDMKDERNDINFQRLRNRDDINAARLFSRQSTTLSRQSSSYGYGDDDCLWVHFTGCNAFLPHKDSQ